MTRCSLSSLGGDTVASPTSEKSYEAWHVPPKRHATRCENLTRYAVVFVCLMGQLKLQDWILSIFSSAAFFSHHLYIWHLTVWLLKLIVVVYQVCVAPLVFWQRLRSPKVSQNPCACGHRTTAFIVRNTSPLSKQLHSQDAGGRSTCTADKDALCFTTLTIIRIILLTWLPNNDTLLHCPLTRWRHYICCVRALRGLITQERMVVKMWIWRTGLQWHL